MADNTFTHTITALWQKVALVIFGILLTLLLLEAGLRLTGFIILSLQNCRNTVSIRQRGEYRIMCLGESTTQNQYPYFLEKILAQRKIGIKFSVIDKGISGINTSTVVSQLEFNLERYHPNMVIAMIGINDRGEHMPYEAISDSKINLFLRSFRTYKLAKVLWLHILTKTKEIDSGKRFKSNPSKFELKEACAKEVDSVSRIGSLAANLKMYIELGWFYREQGKFSQAEQVLKKALKISPENNDVVYLELGWLYWMQDKFFQAEKALKKAIELNLPRDIEYAAISVLYQEMGKSELAKEYETKMQRLRLSYCNPVTVDSYHKLKGILDKRGIRLVCVQYPMRSIEPLKKIFQGKEEGIIFVDNEKVFKDVLKMASCKEYFSDMFGGDFGHCTPKGNRLLAENIADMILKEAFKR